MDYSTSLMSLPTFYGCAGTSHAPRCAAASPRPEGHLLRHRAFTAPTALTPSKEASPSHLPKSSPDTSSGDDRVAAGGAVSSASATSPPSAPSPGASLAPEVELPWPAPRSWAEVALGKLLDTVEDVGVIARRTLSERLPGCVCSALQRDVARHCSGSGLALSPPSLQGFRVAALPGALPPDQSPHFVIHSSTVLSWWTGSSGQMVLGGCGWCPPAASQCCWCWARAGQRTR